MVTTTRKRSPLSRVLRAFGYTLAFLTVTIVVLVAVVALNFGSLTPYATDAISRSTGREFRVDGDVEARLFSWRPRLILEKVSFANPEWSKEPRMLEIGRLHVGVAIWPMLHGNLVIPKLHLDDAVVRLEERKDGTNNWDLWAADAAEAAAPDDRTEAPAIRHLRLRDARLLYTKEGAPQSATDLHFDEASGTVAKVIRIDGKGRYQKNPARMKIEAGSIAQLHEKNAIFPIDVALSAGATTATMVGNLEGPLDEGGLDVTLKVKGDSLSDLYALIGVVLPKSPPYEFAGKLERHDTAWLFGDFSGRLGDSDLSGNLSVDVGPERPVMSASLRSKLLDFDDLAGLVGAPPATGAGETASAEQIAEVAADRAQGRVLPDAPVDVPRLQAMDIYARLVATRVNAPNHLPIDDLELNLSLVNGQLKAQPAIFNVASGRVEMNATLHTDRKPLHADVSMRARGLSAARILGPTPFTNETSGRLGGDVKLAMQGNSLRAMMGTADGTMQLALTDASVSKLLVELIGLDIMKSIGVLIRGDEPTVIRCGAFDLVADNGQITSNLAVLDTEKSSIEAEISMNLDTEQVNVRVVPHPKDVSLLSLRQDLLVEGKLIDLDYYPDPLKIGPVKGFMQKVNYVLAPIVGLLTPFDLSAKDEVLDSGCSAFLRERGVAPSKTAQAEEAGKDDEHKDKQAAKVEKGRKKALEQAREVEKDRLEQAREDEEDRLKQARDDEKDRLEQAREDDKNRKKMIDKAREDEEDRKKEIQEARKDGKSGQVAQPQRTAVKPGPGKN